MNDYNELTSFLVEFKKKIFRKLTQNFQIPIKPNVHSFRYFSNSSKPQLIKMIDGMENHTIRNTEKCGCGLIENPFP